MSPADGRWQRGEEVEGFYLADSPETAWAEWYRALSELAVRPMQQMPRDLWSYRVDLDRVADLSSQERLDRVGLPDLVADRRQWPAFQAVGEALWKQGSTGVMYPAAARPDRSLAICVFRTGPDIPGVTPEPPPEREEEPPAPPRGLRT
ncbi:MAG: RES family NAD+ phosphorylase [Acidimicrobiales bacterium]